MFFAQEILRSLPAGAVPWPTDDCPERVVFANASQMRFRGRGVAAVEDGGRTWIASRTFNPGPPSTSAWRSSPTGLLAYSGADAGHIFPVAFRWGGSRPSDAQ